MFELSVHIYLLLHYAFIVKILTGCMFFVYLGGLEPQIYSIKDDIRRNNLTSVWRRHVVQ